MLNYNDGSPDPVTFKLTKAENNPELLKAAGDSPAAPPADGGIPPVGAPVSAARLKEIEGWLVENTWDAAGIPYYFAANGNGTSKTGAAGKISGWKWELQRDGTILIAQEPRGVFTLESATVCYLLKDSQALSKLVRQKLTKVANDAELVKAAK